MPSTTDSQLNAVLEDVGFSIFQNVQDLGYFSWTPSGAYKNLSRVTAKDLLKGIDCRGRPHQVLPIEDLRCPRSFAPFKADKNWNRYPYNPSYIAPYYVAVKDRDCTPDIGFVFGGSTLHMLATQRIDSNVQYLAQQIPGTKVVTVEKHSQYQQNRADIGFQFERFVCGQGHTRKPDGTTFEHLQVVDIGSSRVLFSTECDGIDEHGVGVEIKCSNRKNWKQKVVFQMISGGSLSLYAGTRTKKGNSVISVENLSLQRVAEIAFANQPIGKFEGRIKSGMADLQEAASGGVFDDGHVHEISFVGGRLVLDRVQLFPSASTIYDLLATEPTKKTTKTSPKNKPAPTPAKSEEMGDIRTFRPSPAQRDQSYPSIEELERMPPEFAIGYGYIPEDFCGFDSD